VENFLAIKIFHMYPHHILKKLYCFSNIKTLILCTFKPIFQDFTLPTTTTTDLNNIFILLYLGGTLYEIYL